MEQSESGQRTESEREITDGAAPDERAAAGPSGFWHAVGRGLRLRCPMCGVGQLFRGLIRMEPTCSECGFQFERGPGYFLGSTYINYGITAALTTWSYVVLHFLFRVSNQVLMPALLLFCAIFPLVFFRYARSLWLSVDSYIDRVGAAESRPVTGRSGDRRETHEES